MVEKWTALKVDAVVALEPEATPILRAARRPYLALEDGYDPRRIVDLADPILERQRRWAMQLDRWLQSRVPGFAQHDFRPASLYLYWLKIVFDSLAIRAYPMTWALERWRPSWVWHPGAAASDSEFGWDLMFRKSLYPAVIRAVAAKLKIDAAVSLPPPAAQQHNDPMSLAHWTRRPTATDWLRRQGSAIRALLESAPRVLRPTAGDLLLLGDGYDLRPVRRAAARAGMAVGSWSAVVNRARMTTSGNDDLSGRMMEAWAAALTDADVLGPATVDGCDFRDTAEARLRFWWEVLIPQQWRAFAATREQWSAARSAAIAVAGLSDHIERGAFAAMRSLGARTYVYQHGGFVGACECPPWDCNDLALAAYELTYGSGTSDYFSSRGTTDGVARAMPIAVGSSRLDGLRRSIRRGRARRRRARVVLIPNLIPRNNRYFDAGTTPDILESELQEALVAMAREFPQYDFIFKAFPYQDQRDTPAVALARTTGSNCHVEFEQPLPALIARADLIVVLFPSTALLEALLTDKPVIVLVDPRFVRMRPPARAALERRAIVSSSPEDFVEQVRERLRRGDFTLPAAVDDQFLRDYGTHLDDGKSAERALAALASTPAVDAFGRIALSPPRAT